MVHRETYCGVVVLVVARNKVVVLPSIMSDTTLENHALINDIIDTVFFALNNLNCGSTI